MKLVPELQVLQYEERLRAMKLMTLEERRERGDLIAVYRLINHMDKVDNENLLLTREEERRQMKGHMKKLRKARCRNDMKKCSFPQRRVVTWNELREEVVEAGCVSLMKEKLGKYIYGDRTK